MNFVMDSPIYGSAWTHALSTIGYAFLKATNQKGIFASTIEFRRFAWICLWKRGS